jgi:hypothetical protein
MIASSAILRPIRDVSVDYKDDASVCSTARTVKASNHDPQLLAQRKKVRIVRQLPPDILPLHFETCRFEIAVSIAHSAFIFTFCLCRKKMSTPSSLSGERRLTGESMEQTMAKNSFQ